MTEILLTHCNHIFFDGKQARKMQPYPPLQTLIAAACLRADGFEVALFDTTLKAPEQGFRKVNTPLFAAPGTTVNTATFGVVTSRENAPRQVQLGLKILLSHRANVDCGADSRAHNWLPDYLDQPYFRK